MQNGEIVDHTVVFRMKVNIPFIKSLVNYTRVSLSAI